tara:strand:- start:721 stop:912 length:192 start_codon:yes stop_codon:yes gene_type:complete
MSNNNTHQSIIRQSMLKAAVDVGLNKGYSLSEIMGIAMGFAEYAETGSFETIKLVESKLSNKS